MLTEREVADYFGVSVRKVHEMRAAGLLPQPVVLGPRLLRWVRAELDEAVKRMPRAGMLDVPPSLKRGSLPDDAA
jgi:excisionase family DNA binding protein